MKVTILGCGGSGGVPQVGLGWGACDPANRRNRRRRCSVLVEAEGATILIDTSPDCREQLLDAGVKKLDAVLYTHAHADHLHGIDDLRSVNRAMRRPIPLWASRATLDEIAVRFGYAVKPQEPGSSFYRPMLVPNEIAGPVEIAGIPVVPFVQDHGFSTTLGFRIGDFAYSTDVVELDEAAFATLAGTKAWVVDCLRREPHPTHSHLARTLSWIERVGPDRAVLTHMDPVLDYESLRRDLPQPVEPGYDGLVLEL